jgi:glucose/arabinose dehydrogenase
MWPSFCRYTGRLVAWLAFVLLAGGANQPAVAYSPAGAGHSVNLPAISLTKTPPPDTIALVPYISGFNTDTVTDITHAGDGRLFLLERQGRIRVALPGGTLLPEPFLDITHLNVSTFNWEQGILGLAFHPNYASNGYFYLTFTANPDEDIRLMRFQVSANDPNIADPNSGLLMLQIHKPLTNEGIPSEVHNGGDLNFGPDGYLYLGLGDGGPDPWIGSPEPGDPNNHSQRMDILLGKILRLDVDAHSPAQPDCGSTGYTIPADNPFADGPGGDCDEIWASGLRNPWRFGFDRATGDMYIGDVGEWMREEINFQPAGSSGGDNYGWHCHEGNVNYANIWPAIAPHCTAVQNYVFPIFEYNHQDFTCFSVIGGSVYRGGLYPNLYGQYLFADLCSARFWRAAQVDGEWEVVMLGEFNNLVAPSVIGEAANGELYVGSFQHSIIYHITAP